MQVQSLDQQEWLPIPVYLLRKIHGQRSLAGYSPWSRKESDTTEQLSTVRFSSVTQLCPTLRPHGLQHTRLPCLSPTPRACSNSCASSQWCHPTISSSVIPFSFRLQSFPASRSFPMSQLFASGGQSIAVSASASVLLMSIQDRFPLGLTSFICLQSKLSHKLITNLFIVFY